VNETKRAGNVLLRSSKFYSTFFFFPAQTALENFFSTNEINSKGSRVRKHLLEKCKQKYEVEFSSIKT